MLLKLKHYLEGFVFIKINKDNMLRLKYQKCLKKVNPINIMFIVINSITLRVKTKSLTAYGWGHFDRHRAANV